MADSSRARQVRRGKRLEYFTVGYNGLEGLITVGAGLFAGSIALVGFGFDSAIEVLSGAVLLWRLNADADEKRRERVEAVAVRLVGWLFLALAAYVVFDSSKALLRHERPHESRVGIALAAISVVVMPMPRCGLPSCRRSGDEAESVPLTSARPTVNGS